jgi:hypothetical protein
VVGRRGEEAAVLGVGEALDDRVARARAPRRTSALERRLVQREQRLEQERVVLEVGVQARLAALKVRSSRPSASRIALEHERGAARAAAR